jgi:hypothetical protein
VKATNLGVAFLLELCLLAILGFWGFHVTGQAPVKWILGLGVPVVVAVVWSVIAAPMSTHRWQPVPLLVFKISIFTLAAAGLYAVKHKTVAGIFEGVSLLNLVLGFIWKQ